MDANSNGSNKYGVSYSIIVWFENALRGHKNVESFIRRNDVVFEVKRKKQKDTVVVFCADEYGCGLDFVVRVLSDFPECQCIYVGGNWNGYTADAKAWCVDSHVSLIVSGEIAGALWKDDIWTFTDVDDEGNPVHIRKSA